jgi:hypothetical protein
LQADVLTDFDKAVRLDVEPREEISQGVLQSDGDSETSYPQRGQNGGDRYSKIIEDDHPANRNKDDLDGDLKEGRSGRRVYLRR